MSRLFVAIELPDRVKQELAQLKSPIPGARWVPQEQLHLTLAFLGDVDGTAAEQLIRALSEVRVPGFTLRLSETGCFPNRSKPRVLWVGLKNNPQLNRLAEQIRSAVLACSILQEERPFSAHITIARLKQPAGREVARFLDQPFKHDLSTFAVREFILYCSQLTSDGALHIPLKKYPLLTCS